MFLKSQLCVFYDISLLAGIGWNNFLSIFGDGDTSPAVQHELNANLKCVCCQQFWNKMKIKRPLDKQETWDHCCMNRLTDACHVWPPPPSGPGAVLSAHLPDDGACRLHWSIQHPRHFIRTADQQLRLWTRRQPAAQHGVTLFSALPCWVCDVCEPLGAHTKTKDYNLHWIIYQPVISHKHLYWFCRLILLSSRCYLSTNVSSVLNTKVFVQLNLQDSMHVPAQIYKIRKTNDCPGKTRLNWNSWTWLEANTRTMHAASLGLNKSHEYRVL